MLRGAARGAARAAAHNTPPQFFTIHVGNLSPAIHGDMLRSIFGHFGTIVGIRFIAQKGPVNYGFVDYATEAAAQAALSMMGTEFDGRKLRVELAKSTAPAATAAPKMKKERRLRSASSSSSRSRSPAWRRKRSRSRGGSGSESRRSTNGEKLKIGDGRGIAVDSLFDAAPKLEEYVRKVEKDTRATCVGFGTIKSVIVPRPKVASQRVWIEFDDAREAAAAAAFLASRTYDGRTLAVEIVDSWHARAARPVDPPDAKMPRLAADAAYHRAQHELLKARVEELEAELEVTRASAQKGRDFHSSRISALAKRCEDLEKDRDRELL